MLSFLRAPHPERTNQAAKNPVFYENGTSSVQYNAPPATRAASTPAIMTHTIPPSSPTEGPSIVQPPFHYHIYQTETFHVQKGTALCFFGLDKSPTKTLTGKTSGSSGEDTAVLGPCRYHRFENPSKTEDLVIDIQLDPEDYENEQRFFRNFFGYLDDCKRTKSAPSIFQLFVFLHSADTPLAIPMPNLPGMETVGVWLSRALLITVAGIGRVVLGYQQSYPEYYDSSKSK